MRILFTTTGAAGHAFPMAPLAAALTDQGHEVTFAVVKGRVHDDLSAAGFAVVDAGIDIMEAFGRVLAEQGLSELPTDPGAHNLIGGEVFGRVQARAMAEDVVARLTDHPVDLVVAENGCVGGMLAAHRVGVPCVAHAVSRRVSGQGPFEVPIVSAFVRLAAEYGLDIPADGTLPAHHYLNTFPAALDSGAAPPPAATAIRPVPWNPPVAARPRRPRPDRPWVYLTFGTVFDGAAVLRPIAAELADLDVDVLIAAGGSGVEGLDGLGARVTVEPFVPQAELMDQFSLVVHHAGSGTTLAAAARGVPQIVLPLGADQLGNAEAVAAAGIGRRLDPLALAPGSVSAAARELLADGPHTAAIAAVAAEIAAMPTPHDLAADLDSWAHP